MSSYGVDPLVAISEQNHPVADLARDFLAGGTEWSIDDWFLKRTKTHYQGQDMNDNEAFSLENLTYSFGSSETRNVRLVSIRPFYFRGFRDLESPINLDADLVTVDGKNSSGKTSLAEAIEWLLSGNIQRRDQGDPTELADFVANCFRPKGQKTWVECNLAVDGETTTIKRILISDYDSKKNSRCSSQLFVDGKEIEGPLDVLDEFFASVAPLLLQHTLREFVLKYSNERPKYFEKLLNISEISDLIADAQVSNQRHFDFPRPGGGKALSDWGKLTEAISVGHFRSVRQFSKLDGDSLREAICGSLIQIAADKFATKCKSDIESCISVIISLQEQELRRRFPALQDFQPKENFSEATFIKLSDDSQNDRLQLLEKARTDYLTALESQETISKAKVSIAKALEPLREAQLIKDEEQQICPICVYQPVPTLTKERLDDIDLWTESWNPTKMLLEQTWGEFEKAVTECLKVFEDLGSLRNRLVPATLPVDSVQAIGEIANDDIFEALVTAHSDANRELKTFDSKTSLALTELKKCDPELDIRDTLHDALSLVPTLQHCAEEYARKYAEFQQYLNKLATSDEEYRTRKDWLNIAHNRDQLILDIQWEAAKDRAGNELSNCRELLIAARQQYLGRRQKEFNDGITDIWSKLRKDKYSTFGGLVIPEPRGRGQKARIEVKAKLSSNSRTQEVHALNVLSESQINAIGIAAFVTRSRLLGHKILVFDDPVQSMDDDHFKSFAGSVLSYLCDNGFQVIVLTHNDDFARDVTLSHSDRESRISMEIQHTRKRGISVNEGNRSVSGRLNKSLAYWDDGEYDAAWVRLRIAIERLYLLIRMKRGTQPFEWRKWKKMSAEKMWKRCVKDLVFRLFPEIAPRLCDIVFMTGGGAHSRQADGETDFRSAVGIVRELQSKMQVGD